MKAVSRGLGPHISGCEIWSTNSMPVDNSMEAEAAQRASFVKKYNYVGNGQGTTIRIVEWAPGHAMFPHRTETMDYSMVLSGEIDVEFDSGQLVTMRQGDVIVMRGRRLLALPGGGGLGSAFGFRSLALPNGLSVFALGLANLDEG